jgi:hypothetical protein
MMKQLTEAQQLLYDDYKASGFSVAKYALSKGIVKSQLDYVLYRHKLLAERKEQRNVETSGFIKVDTDGLFSDVIVKLKINGYAIEVRKQDLPLLLRGIK